MPDSPGLYAFGGPLFRSPITIDHTQVPATQSDFPLLVSLTDNRFKSIANGGHVRHASGYDIRPSIDPDGTAPMTFELESYNASTGAFIMWVKIPTMFPTIDTTFYLTYGNPVFTTDGSSVNTWSNNFLGVYHLKDGSTLDVNSATGSNNGTNNGATATTLQINGAAALASASSQFIDCGTGMHPTGVTVSAWVNATSFPNAYNSVIARVNTNDYWALYVKSTGKLACYIANSPSAVNYDGTGLTTLSAGTTYLLHMTFSGFSSGFLKGYVNGSEDGSLGAGFSLSNNAITCDLGKDPLTAGRLWNGVLDECRISSVARSADWVSCEYNNQKSGSTFITLGAES